MDEGQERVRNAYGEAKHERLVGLKNRFDPKHLSQVQEHRALATGSVS
jgi:hypothetical protein